MLTEPRRSVIEALEKRDGRTRSARPWLTAACVMLAALVAAAALSACGDQSPAAAKGGGSEAMKGGAAAPGKSGGAPSQGPKTAVASTSCERQLGAFLASMDGLRAQLVAGVSYEQYVGEVQTIRSIYERIPVDAMALGCLRAAGTPAERGLNRYIAAGNTWSDCVEETGCESASIEGALQSKWKQASEELSKARRGLKRLGSG